MLIYDALAQPPALISMYSGKFIICICKCKKVFLIEIVCSITQGMVINKF
jgi:hypothetical protein